MGTVTVTKLRALLGVAVVAAALAPRANAAIIFQDTFAGGSDVNNASPMSPTATKTSYINSSSKGWFPTPSIASGDYRFGINNTTSGVVEAQARIPSTTLTNTGDFIEMQITFTNGNGTTSSPGNLLTQAMLTGWGMYNSAGSNSVGGGLNGTATNGTANHTADGTINWQGYVAQLSNATTSRIMDRKVQNSGTITDQDQDVVSSGSASSTYNNPSASGVGSNTGAPTAVALTNGNQYTEDLKITLLATGALQLDEALYNGAGTGGSTVFTPWSTTTGTTPLTTTFDALGYGWRATANSAGTNPGYSIDTNSILVQTGTAGAVPEPMAMALLGLAGVALSRRRAHC